MSGGAIMNLTKNQTISLLFMGGGTILIIMTAYLVQRIKYKTNGPLICLNWCCTNDNKKDAIVRMIFVLDIIK